MIAPELLAYQLKAKRKSLIYFFIGLFSWGFLITALYPTVSGITAFSDYWGQFPEGIKNLFGGHEVNILRPEGYITLEYYQLFLPIILSAFAFGFAAFCVVKARENGSLEFLLSHPIERRRYALTSTISLCCGLAALSALAVGTVMLTCLIFGIDVSWLGQLKFMALAFLFVIALGSITLCASCALNKSGQVYGVGITVLAVSYLVNFLSNTWAFFRFIDHALPYHYYAPYETMTNPGFPWSSAVYFLAIFIAFSILSVIALQRRDIAV
jgi:beta-exotoxin I transport system permease protein